jgi:hypothetical protein
VVGVRSAKGTGLEDDLQAVTVGEDDVHTRVDRQTVILVVDGGLVDGDTGGMMAGDGGHPAVAFPYNERPGSNTAILSLS